MSTNTNSKKNTDECIELKNINYKSMLMNKNQSPSIMDTTSSTQDIEKLDKYLETEKTNNKADQWIKLNMPVKIKKLVSYATKYQEQHHISDDEKMELIEFFKNCITHKRLQRAKDVIYDKNTGEIKDIVGLTFNKTTNKFTIKNNNKNVSTLKTLTQPKKNNITIKNTDMIHQNIENNSNEDIT